MQIKKTFHKIRYALNEREEILLNDIDIKFDEIFFKNDIISKSEKLEKMVKLQSEKGKLIDKKWDDKNKLISIINDCINIEKIINDINQINKYIKKYHKENIKIKLIPEKEPLIKIFIENNINNFGRIIIDYPDVFNISYIIDYNKEYSQFLKKWLNKDHLKIECLYRLSRDGDKISSIM